MKGPLLKKFMSRFRILEGNCSTDSGPLRLKMDEEVRIKDARDSAKWALSLIHTRGPEAYNLETTTLVHLQNLLIIVLTFRHLLRECLVYEPGMYTIPKANPSLCAMQPHPKDAVHQNDRKEANGISQTVPSTQKLHIA
jgi:hypothetical protein